MKVYNEIYREYHSRWGEEYFLLYQRYASVNDEEASWLKKKACSKMIWTMRNENRSSDREAMKKDAVEATLRAFCENLFKTPEEKAGYTYRISVMLNRTTDEIKVNKETNSHAQYVEGVIEEKTVDPDWETAKDKFIK